jgi:hypothetical protein
MLLKTDSGYILSDKFNLSPVATFDVPTINLSLGVRYAFYRIEAKPYFGTDYGSSGWLFQYLHNGSGYICKRCNDRHGSNH